MDHNSLAHMKRECKYQYEFAKYYEIRCGGEG